MAICMSPVRMNAAVLVVDPDTGAILKRYGHEAGVHGPDDVAVAPDGSIYWTDIFEGRVGRLGADGSMSSQMVGVGVNPIVFSSDGRLFAALAFLGDALFELDPNLIEPPRLLAENLGGLNSFQFGPDGKLYAPLMDKGQVVRIDVDAEPIEIEVIAEGLWPVAVKVDSKGQVYANGDPNANPTGITRVDVATGELETVAVTPSGSDNFAFDANDRLFATLLGEGTIAEVMEDGSLRMLGPVGMVSPGGVTIRERADGESIFVADLWMLQEFDSATGEFLGKVDNLMPNTVVVDGDNLLITSWFGNAVFVWNPDAKELVEEYYDFNMPMNTIRFQGDLVVAELGTGSVVRVSAADPAQRTTLAAGFVKPMGLATDDENLWLSDRDTGKVWQVIADGEPMEEPRLIAQGLYRPEGMAIAPDGRLLVTETGTGRLLSIDLKTGATSIMTENLGFSPIYPEGMIPWGMMSSIAVSPSGTIFVTADEANVVYRIEPGQ
jgi:sugar lactone lactonase YvrE